METRSGSKCGGESSWSSATNWTIVGGSLENSVTFESLVSPINEDEQDSDVAASRSPLILRSPSPDSGPCQIAICFPQKHEVQQVYVRSTAKVYEIYYAPDLRSINEYLCTVKCGLAFRGEAVLSTVDSGDVLSWNLKSSKDHAEDSLRSQSNLSTDEDGWVEVKVNETAVVNAKEKSNHAGYKQDLYEATAEISDASPCTSLTLRLLSLQSKDSVHIDEVYVYADPVDPASSEEVPEESSGRNSLMNMLVPTLLQLSKTSDTRRMHNRQKSETPDKSKTQDLNSRVDNSTEIRAKPQSEGTPNMADHEEVTLKHMSEAHVASLQSQSPQPVPVSESKHDHPLPGFGGNALELLILRMDRLENLFLRFESSILNPINRIEARVQHIEEQLEVLSKTPEDLGMPSGLKISAPEFSCNESDSFLSSSGIHCPGSFSSESDKKDFHSDMAATVPSDKSNSENTIPLVPALKITAPEFSRGDDEEKDSTEEPAEEANDNRKKVMSIDDALAFALAGFVSSASIQTPKFDETPVKASKISNEECHEEDQEASPRAQSEEAAAHSGDKYQSDCMRDSALSSEEEAPRSRTGEPAEGVDTQSQCHGGGENSCQEVVIDGAHYSLPEHVVGETEACTKMEERENEEAHHSRDVQDSPENSHQSEIDGSHDPSQADYTEASNESLKDILHNAFGFSIPASVVDFNRPVTDVKFTSLGNPGAKSLLETLIADLPESKIEAPRGDQEPESLATERGELILVEEGEAVDSKSERPFSLDMSYCSMLKGPSEGESLQDFHGFSGHETLAGSLI